MQSIRFNFHGMHELILPDGEVYAACATDVIEQRSYPFPADDSGQMARSVVDLGAHAGEFTIMAAARWPRATIHAFEPNPQILPLLYQNCRPYSNIVIYEQAVDVKPGRNQLYSCNGVSVAAALLLEPPGGLPDGRQWVCADVEVVGPDAVLALIPDVLKIDIEGPESVVIEAMGKAIERIGRIYVEFHGETVRRHLDQLLLPTHCLAYSRILQPQQGELMYVRREIAPPL